MQPLALEIAKSVLGPELCVPSKKDPDGRVGITAPISPIEAAFRSTCRPSTRLGMDNGSVPH